LNKSKIEETKKWVLSNLDKLVEKKRDKIELRPFKKKEIVKLDEVDKIIKDLKEHFRDYTGELEIEINAEPRGE